MSTYQTPGVYVEEVASQIASVAQVDTAIPAFVGYTENSVTGPQRISSLVEFEDVFGGPSEDIMVTLNDDNTFSAVHTNDLEFKLFYSLRLYFGNGGGPCYVVSAGTYSAATLTTNTEITNALALLAKEDEPTMLVLTDGTSLDADDYYDAVDAALMQCNTLGDRITLVDVAAPISTGNTGPEDLRDAIVGVGNNFLKYGAAYYPNLIADFTYPDKAVIFAPNTGTGIFNGMNLADVRELALTTTTNGATAARVLSTIINGVDAERATHPIVLPPSGAMAGIMARVDRNRGVWKAPANVVVELVTGPAEAITADDQASLNIDPTGGKSINAIRTFPGKGTLVWGARTLAGNDNEWRYVPVRRFYNMVEESVKKSTHPFVFEPNDGNTHTRLRTMIENYLTRLWREGALAGATPEQAFFVKAGLGSTMTSDDILNGRLNVEIGMAAVRPAEFIILRFTHIMQQS